MMIFGDSLSDNGNLKLWLKVMPEFPYWFGRFTDGITWSEYLRKSANITMSNWAIGGAKSGNINDFNTEEIIEYVKTEGRNFITGSVSTTIDRYLQNCLTNGSTIDQKTTEDTIYVIWIGANDYLEKFDDTNTFLRLIDHPNETGGYEEVSSRAVENIVTNIKKLNDKGARYFLIPNLPDIGVTPIIATTPYDFTAGTVKTRAELSMAMSNVIKTHNKKLNEYLSLLAKERQEQLTILYVDIFNDFNMLLQNKNPFNETDFDPQFRNGYHGVNVGNSDTQRIPKKCFQGGYTALQSGWNISDWINYASTNTCRNLDQSYNSLSTFWDNVHPTSYAHSFIAYSFHYHMRKAELLSIEPPEIEQYREKILASYFHQ